MGRKGKKDQLEREVLYMHTTPIDRQLIAFLQEKSFNTQTITSIVREALAYRAESKGMDVMALYREQKNESTPA